jgi:hypothetical protein
VKLTCEHEHQNYRLTKKLSCYKGVDRDWPRSQHHHLKISLLQIVIEQSVHCYWKSGTSNSTQYQRLPVAGVAIEDSGNLLVLRSRRDRHHTCSLQPAGSWHSTHSGMYGVPVTRLKEKALINDSSSLSAAWHTIGSQSRVSDS